MLTKFLPYRGSVFAFLTMLLLTASAQAAFTTVASGVYDSTNQANTVDVNASGTANNVTTQTLTAFNTKLSTAVTATLGGVVNFDDITVDSSTLQDTITVTYGGSKILNITQPTAQYQMDMGSLTAINATPISGSRYLRSGDANGNQVYNFSTPLTDVGITVLARTGARTITATVTYDNATTGTLTGVAIASYPTSTGTAPIATSTPDTFFGFTAPTGRTITGLTLSAGANNYFVVDDLAFIVSPTAIPEPGTWAVVIAGVFGGAGLYRRRRSH
jgi:hypothetical protein